MRGWNSFFVEWFYYNLIMKIWKLWRAPTTLQFNISTFPTYQCLQKGVWDFFYCLDLELFAKIKKDLVSTHSFFTLLLITQDLGKTKKSRIPFCRHYEVENVCKISAKNIKLYVSWSSSKFSDKKPVFFFENNRSLPSFGYRILHNLISTTKLLRN